MMRSLSRWKSFPILSSRQGGCGSRGQANQRGVRFPPPLIAARKSSPLRHAAPNCLRLCPSGPFFWMTSGTISGLLAKVYTVLKSFSPQVEMASVDEAYLDVTGTERLHGPPLRAANSLHNAVKKDTGLIVP